MTDAELDTDFSREIEGTYKGERYLVRDNGAVLRYSRVGKRQRALDNHWTFGNPNDNNGFMEIASVSVHRIVAVVFQGEPPTKHHVVDHIDTNKRNNRPENLRWVTRLENVLLNPITAKRIAIVCGSVEAFLADPVKFRHKFLEPNFDWMRRVSKEEAQTSYERLLAWAKSDKLPSGRPLDQWIFDRTANEKRPFQTIPQIPALINAKTFNATQLNWRTPSEFPCCPQEITGEPITAYAEKLKTGSVFCHNHLYSSVVLKSAVSDERQSLYVISESKDAIKPWALAKITYENDLYMHASLGNFFTQEGAEKQYCLAQGLEWLGGDSIDDYS